MEKWKTKNGVEIFRILSGRSNSYLICSENGNVLVDTGKESSFGRLLKNLESPELPKHTIDLLILTHTHFDHCQNAHALQNQFKCKILLGVPEAEFSKAGYSPLPRGTSMFTRLLVKLGNWIGNRRFGFHSFNPDIILSGETILEPFPIRIIPTPGHSKGSVSVIVDREIALVGDTLFGVFRNSAMPPFADDVAELFSSWELLIQTNCRTFLPGHGTELTRELLKREFIKYTERPLRS